MLEYDPLKLCELLQFLKVLMIYDQIESNVGQVHLLHLIVELGPLKDFESVSENVQDPI